MDGGEKGGAEGERGTGLIDDGLRAGAVGRVIGSGEGERGLSQEARGLDHVRAGRWRRLAHAQVCKLVPAEPESTS